MNTNGLTAAQVAELRAMLEKQRAHALADDLHQRFLAFGVAIKLLDAACAAPVDELTLEPITVTDFERQLINDALGLAQSALEGGGPVGDFNKCVALRMKFWDWGTDRVITPAPTDGGEKLADRDSDEARRARGLVSTRDTYRRLGWNIDQIAPDGGETASPESDEDAARRLHMTVEAFRDMVAKHPVDA